MTPPTLEELKEFRRGLNVCYRALSSWIGRLEHEPLNDDISDLGRMLPPQWSANVLMYHKDRLLKKDIEFLGDCVEAGESYDLTERRIAWFRDIARKVKMILPIGCG